MTDAMVTGRMSEEKKRKASRILEASGLNASAAINLLFDRIIEEGDASFLLKEQYQIPLYKWQEAADFLEDLHISLPEEFRDMTIQEARIMRLTEKDQRIRDSRLNNHPETYAR